MPDNPELQVRESEIPNLFEVDLVIHPDDRGWFKENWNKRDTEALGLPEFTPTRYYTFYKDRSPETLQLPNSGNLFVSLAEGRAEAQVSTGNQEGVYTLDAETALFIPEGASCSLVSEEEAIGTFLTDAETSSAEEVKAKETSIPGLTIFDLNIDRSPAGWIKQGWDQARMPELAKAGFVPVQNNISFNAEKGVTRGIHAEPWNKLITVANGEVFAAIVDLREGDNFDQTETFYLGPDQAIYVPEGCGNSFQALSETVSYTYLVDEHWSPEAKYTMLNLADPDVGVRWPIPLNEAILSENDENHPFLDDVTPVNMS